MAGEGVVVEVNGAEEEAVGEGQRDGAVEVVGVEAQPAELGEFGERVAEFATELEARQAEVEDSVVVTEHAAPVARR